MQEKKQHDLFVMRIVIEKRKKKSQNILCMQISCRPKVFKANGFWCEQLTGVNNLIIEN